jgi:NAD+ diphosphatase
MAMPISIASVSTGALELPAQLLRWQQLCSNDVAGATCELLGAYGNAIESTGVDARDGCCTVAIVSTTNFIPGLTPPAQLARPLLVVVRGVEVLVEACEGELRLPERPELAPLAGPQVYLGQLGERPCFAAPLLGDARLPKDCRLILARQLASGLDATLASLVGQALALVEWDILHRYCGGCAVMTEVVPCERARRCPRCGATFYPRISPAVIVLVERNQEILLARNANFPAGRFSLVAGFVEPGEALEQSAVREVREEVGIEISDLRYDGSQPWPFGRSLMIGFHARYAGGEVRVDGVEIAEAGWFSLDRLPDLPPPISIARKMIDRFVANR